MATDAETIVSRMSSNDATLGAASNATFWANRAIVQHTKASWKASDGTYDAYYDAMAWWALHHMIMVAREAAGAVAPAGPIQSRRNGDVSITYAIAASPPITAVDGDLSRTTYGLLYLAARGTLAVGVAGVV